MTQPTAQMNTAIRIVTLGVIVLTAFLIASAYFHPQMGFVALLMMAVVTFCYLTAPVRYELHDGKLTICTHVGSKTFEPVVACEPGEIRPFSGIRVFGNGGLFAGTGFYWNTRYGLHRAYVTSSREIDLVMVRTPTQKILISPSDPHGFMETCRAEIAGRA